MSEYWHFSLKQKKKKKKKKKKSGNDFSHLKIIRPCWFLISLGKKISEAEFVCIHLPNCSFL